MFKSLGNLAALMKQAHLLGGRMQALTDRLKQERVTGSAGGGMVEVEANGLGEILRVRIDPSLLSSAERDMLETLAPTAINQALEKARQKHTEAMQAMAGQLDIKNLQEMIQQMTGAPPDDSAGRS
jgi:nucleoid-associated protein EbfC